MQQITSFDPEILELPFYEDQHRRLAEALGTWCDARTALWDEVRQEDPEKAGLRLVRQLGEDGWLAFLDPESGTEGLPGDHRALCLTREALAYAEDLADFAFSIQALSATPVIRFGSEAQKRHYLPRMATGSLVGAFAVSEEEAGSDVASVALRADRGPDGGYVLNGRKAWIANGSIADVYVVIARTGGAPGALGLTAFLVPADTPGVRVGRRLDALAPRSFAHLDFEDCRVPADAVLGKPGKGFVIAMDLLERFRMTVGAAALGFARRAADTALARARTRSVGGTKLIDLQLTQASLADMDVQLNAAALLVARAAWEADRGSRRFARHSSIAKLYATEEAQRIVDTAVQLLGASGVVKDSVTERLYRQIRALRIYEGTSEVMRLTIAGTLDTRRAARAARDV
ncbi:acyl-CoA dehydrogenase family protein [Streptomyces purpurogeneiscleroticus]|uniref:acyl-CoA dehydrogenase family protein n=1 Tax=Streptomyces purpurogeneiscleroticus TaxID=68259 RepID=UPI001CC128DD|nr:acyl-CoA dehydrogenase family protein [Streptomyces purpurogeneiscleroticus]MBZ4017117.1 acyl-CoA dehydrogenase [Streptomyces purpurogeneiscleroticus]